MRYQKAKQLTDIISLLYSPDHEVVLVGASMLKEHFIIKNLSKHYKKEVSIRWPGWSDSCPNKFKKRSYYNTPNGIFHKSIIDNLFEYTETTNDTTEICLIIISWLYEYTSYSKHKSRIYTNLVSDLVHEYDIKDKASDSRTENSIECAVNKKLRRTKKKKRSKSEINILNRLVLVDKCEKQLGMSAQEEKARNWLTKYLIHSNDDPLF